MKTESVFLYRFNFKISSSSCSGKDHWVWRNFKKRELDKYETISAKIKNLSFNKTPKKIIRSLKTQNEYFIFCKNEIYSYNKKFDLQQIILFRNHQFEIFTKEFRNRPLLYYLDSINIMLILRNFNIVCFHGAAFKISDKTFLCIAKPEGGKTTLCYLLRKIFKNKIKIYADDLVIVDPSNEQIMVSGTPCSSNLGSRPPPGGRLRSGPLIRNIPHNKFSKLDYILFLKKSENTLIKRVPNKSKRRLASVPYVSLCTNTDREALEVCSQIIRKVPIYSLNFNIDSAKLKTLFENSFLKDKT